MNEAIKYTLCRACEHSRLLSLLESKEPKRTITARKIIMTELLKEEVSARYLMQHG